MRVRTAGAARAALVVRVGGALLFLASLAYFAVVYLTSFGRVAADGNPLPAIAWNVLLFTGFGLHHSVFARTRIRQAVARALPPPLERSAYIWIASLLFIAVCAWWQPVPGQAWAAGGAAAWGLRLLQATGVWLTLRSAAALDIRDLAGLRTETASTVLELKTTGPYGWVRHPIYAGWFLFVWAATPMTMTRLWFALLSSAYLLAAIPLEERTMRATAGEAYERYRSRVRWRLVPYVY